MYAYVGNDPVNATDPSGEAAQALLLACIGPQAIACAGVAAGAVVIGGLIGCAVSENCRDDVAGLVSMNERADEPDPGTADSDKGCIYCVAGENTESGKPYVGSADDLEKRASTANDGRDRTGAEIIGEYDKGDKDDRRNAEQRGINEKGGRDNLDNRRNEAGMTEKSPRPQENEPRSSMSKSLPVPEPAQRDSKAVQMASVWIAEKGLHCSLNVGVFSSNGKVDEVKAWGIMIADIARHIADAVAESEALAQKEEILDRLKSTFNEELRVPTSKVSGAFPSNS